MADVAQMLRQVELELLIGVTHAGIRREQVGPLQRLVAGFLQQFPPRGYRMRLAGVDLARGEFKKVLMQRIAELALHQHGVFIEHRQDDHGTGMDNVLAQCRLPVRKTYVVLAHLEQLAVIDELRIESSLSEIAHGCEPSNWMLESVS